MTTTVLITLSSLCTSLWGPSPSRVCIWKLSEGSPTFMVRKGHSAPSSQMPVSLGTVIGRAAPRHGSEAGIQAAEPGRSKGVERQERRELALWEAGPREGVSRHSPQKGGTAALLLPLPPDRLLGNASAGPDELPSP